MLSVMAMMSGRTVVDGQFRWRRDQPDAVVVPGRCQERTIGLDMVVALGIHQNLQQNLMFVRNFTR